MSVRLLQSPDECILYDQWLRTHEEGSLWQSLEWKTYQEAIGREVRIYAQIDNIDQILASALVVIDRTIGGLSTWDIPRGPLTMKSETLIIDDLINRIIGDAQKDRCIALYFSPPKELTFHSSFSILHSSRHEQPETTRIIDLTKSEEEILAQMKQKGRYNISVAKRHNVTIQESHDVNEYLHLVKQTGHRDGFSPPHSSHFSAFLSQIPGAFLLLAYPGPPPSPLPSEGERGGPIAGLIGTTWNGVGIYYYGASSDSSRALMAPYLLQWHAMQHCKSKGCKTYDLFGVAPPNEQGNHAWSGISAFKEKFGGQIIQYPSEQCIVMKPLSLSLLSLNRRILG